MSRLRRPTHRRLHAGWLIIAAVIAAWFTRGTALPLFLGLFFVVWLVGHLAPAALVLCRHDRAESGNRTPEDTLFCMS